ncbi:MAG TPA: phosphatase PAP2 family protein [Gallionella sp.]|nr:phosphatase PAP2 family protein [Gallionella sp.]
MPQRNYSLQRIQTWDDTWCLRFNRADRIPLVHYIFNPISRLGDGIFWFCLMLWLLVQYQAAAVHPVLHMLSVGAASTVIYKWLKHKTHRPRPCDTHRGISPGAAPLDQFSFPSGHTLHAVSFTVVALVYYPALAWLLLPFTALVAVSRLVLGLHYPSDVLAGVLIGVAISLASLCI